VLQLLLLRHAKSSWRDRSLADRDRPLNERGERDAAAIGRAMAERQILPDRILCSPTMRTRQTMALVLDQLPARPEAAIADALYEASGPDYRALIATEGKRARRLLVIGHNPTMQATALALLKQKRDGQEAAIAAKFPTAALAIIELDISTWSQIEEKPGELALFLRPRDIVQGEQWEADD
jgi:phosphohistidine phosphatase